MSRDPSQHDRFMQLAIRMGERSLGTTRPNPAVGAVIVAGGGDRPPAVISRGWTQPGGRPHAETEAMARAGGATGGSTLYVTLEPCSHHGKTPPCADAIIRAGMARVVAGIGDPDRRVAGQGFARLREAGIDVVTGVLRQDAAWSLAGHVLHRAAGRPFVQLKLAVSADNRIAAGVGAPVWVTGPLARSAGHLMRARCDAVLVGRGTVEADDPELTCRLPGMAHRSPIRVVLDSALKLSPASKLLQTRSQAPVWVLCAAGRAASHADVSEFTVIGLEAGAQGGLDPHAVLKALAEREITRLLIEGGPAVAASFLSAGLVDELALFRSPRRLGDTGRPALPATHLAALEDPVRWQIAEERDLAGDRLTIYRHCASPLWGLALGKG